MFVGELSLRQWVKASIPDKIIEVIDDNLLKSEDGRDAIATQGNLLAKIELGLEGSKEFPEERIDIKDVLVKLHMINLQLLWSKHVLGFDLLLKLLLWSSTI